jgi:tetratricopeptide (TPR) repeat protein
MTNEAAWKAAHGRLYEFLRDTTHEGSSPKLEDLAPLYQAIAHGCHAGRFKDALEEVFALRICRDQVTGTTVMPYASYELGALGTDLAALSYFFEKPYELTIVVLPKEHQTWVLGTAAYLLRTQGRLAEAIPAVRKTLRRTVESEDWANAASAATNLLDSELLIGHVQAAGTVAANLLTYTEQSHDEFRVSWSLGQQARVLLAAGCHDEAKRNFAKAERQLRKLPGEYPLLYSIQGYNYCDLLIRNGTSVAARNRAEKTLEWANKANDLLSIALDTLILGRAHLGSAIKWIGSAHSVSVYGSRTAATYIGEAVDRLRGAGYIDFLPLGLLARAAFRRSVGDWGGAARDLDEALEIAEPGPMKLYLCDSALERARLAFARLSAFAPLSGLADDGAPKPALPDDAEAAQLKEEARTNLAKARDLVTVCGYHRRDEELSELEEVAAGRRRFADLPPRV